MNKIITIAVAISTVFTICFTSCKSGDDDDFEILSPEDKVLVSADIPVEGWSGNSGDGIFKYTSSSYDADEVNSYFAFKMKGGVCEKAVLNMVMENSLQAKQFAKMLNSGTWINYDDDDDEDYYQAKARSRAYDMTTAIVRHINRANTSRSDISLPIPVQQNGKVIYVFLHNLQGLSAAELRTAMSLWTGESSEIPDRVIFGTYADGVYTCRNMHAMNIDYVIETKFNSSGFCSKYMTRITLPTISWAEFYFDIYEEQMQDFEQMFGQRPDLKIDGKTILLDAIILGDVSESQINTVIYSMDWLNNCPLIYKLF